MTRSSVRASAFAAALLLPSLATVAVAQDAKAKPDGANPGIDAKKVDPVKAPPEEESKKDDSLDGAVKTMPKWESFGSGDEQVSVEETFFRLAADFVSTAELGYKRLGEVPIWPRGELKVAGMRIVPWVRQGAEWESNVFKRGRTDVSGEGGKGSFTYVSTVGVQADKLLMGGRMRLAGSIVSEWEQRSAKSDRGDDTWEMDAQLGLSYHWPSGLWVSGGVGWERRDDPIEIETSSKGEFKRNNTRFFFQAGMDRDIIWGSKVQLEFGFAGRNLTSKEQDFDSAQHSFWETYVKASYPFWKESTRVFVRTRYRDENRDFDATNDGKVWGWDAGIEGNVPFYDNGYRGLRGSLSVGWDYGTYDDGTFERGGEDLERDDNSREGSLAVQAALQYLISPRSTAELRYVRSQQFSARGSNFQISDRVDLIYNRTLAKQLVGRMAIYGEHSDPSGNEPNQAADGSFNTARTRNISRWGVGLGLRYAINEWVDTDLSWDYTRQNGPGSGAAESYTNHRILLGLTFYLQSIRPPTYGGATVQ